MNTNTEWLPATNETIFVIRVKAPSADHARLVMSERLGYDEALQDEEGNYFDYEIIWADE